MGACMSGDKKKLKFIQNNQPRPNYKKQTTKNLQQITMPSNFDINRGLVVFGKNKKNKNFMLTFDFGSKEFKKIKLRGQGRT
jgi:hypothetical protein